MYDFGQVLSRSLTFYYGQQSGHLPGWNTLNWRNSCALQDGFDLGLDLTGGYHDCGDHVKFHLPLSYSMYMLALTALEYQTTLTSQGNSSDNEWIRLNNILKWGTDYFIKCHPEPNILVGQVGSGELDHVWWGPPEFMEMQRPSWVLNSSAGGSDLAGSIAATLAFYSMITTNVTEKAQSIQHAKDLFSFAINYPALYSVSIPDAAGFYASSGYSDEQLLAALALYWATGDPQYSQYALSNSNTLLQKTLTWAPCWDDASNVNIYLLWKLFPNTTTAVKAQVVFEKWAEFWMSGINYTPSGLAWLTGWGSLRYPLASAFLMLLSIDSGLQTNSSTIFRYEHWALSQINYALGDNPYNRSYLVGFGSNWFPVYHNRAGHGSVNDNMFDPPVNRHTNFELLGGPDIHDVLDDTITNFGQVEGCNDMQAGLVGTATALVKRYGGTHTFGFPPKEVPKQEFFVNGTIALSSPSSIQINTITYIKVGWPPRSPSLSWKLWIASPISPVNNVAVISYYSEGGSFSQWKQSVKSKCVWYVEVSFPTGVLYPQSVSSSQKQVQLTFTWVSTKFASLNWTQSFAMGVPIYEDGKHVAGYEPVISCDVQPSCKTCRWTPF